jgi:hypothetical protein
MLRIPRVDTTRFDAPHALALAQGLRLAIVLACAAAAALGWLAGSSTVVGLAAVIAAEELLEISVVIGALKLDPRLRPATAPR